MYTSPTPAHSLTKGDVISHRGTYLRLTEEPTHDHSGPVVRVRVTTTPAQPGAASHGPVRQLTFGLNQAVARVVGARTGGM